MLKRRNMELDSYTCENCIRQKEETIYEMQLYKKMLATDRVVPPRTSNQFLVVQHMPTQLTKTWRMEIIIIMVWCI